MSDTKPTPIILHTPGTWLSLTDNAHESLVKLGITLAGLDPTDEENEPIDRAAYDQLLINARAHLGAVKDEAKSTRNIHPARIRVVAHPGLLLASIWACPDAMQMAHMISSLNAETGNDGGTDQFNFVTNWWVNHGLWPKIGTEPYDLLQNGYSAAWHMMAGLARNVFGAGPNAVKKRG
jgi:hypothetical protein